jgi:SAM-dependent methyltransferase
MQLSESVVSSDFYKAFEDRYRGSRELIMDRLAVYLPFIEPLKSADGECTALDLGCGRGEWLELLLANGFAPFGVDMDEGMLGDCTSRGLPARCAGALESLTALPGESQAIVTAFHLVEHIAFSDLTMLVVEAWRVLRPGGILILETPNPENILVGTHEFYLDPSHQKPIPPNLLRFLVEQQGFERNIVLRLNPRKDVDAEPLATMRGLLEGVGLDYAVVAQKPAEDAALLALFDDAFSRDSGPTIEMLASKFDGFLGGIISRNDDIVDELQKLGARFAEFEKYRAEEVSRFQAELERAWADSARWHAQTQALLDSYSWKITAPMRAGLRLGTKASGCLKSAVTHLIHYPLRAALDNPRFASRTTHFLQRRFPRLHGALRRQAVATGLMQDSPMSAYGKPSGGSTANSWGYLLRRNGTQTEDRIIPTRELINRIYERLDEARDSP